MRLQRDPLAAPKFAPSLAPPCTPRVYNCFLKTMLRPTRSVNSATALADYRPASANKWFHSGPTPARSTGPGMWAGLRPSPRLRIDEGFVQSRDHLRQ